MEKVWASGLVEAANVSPERLQYLASEKNMDYFLDDHTQDHRRLAYNISNLGEFVYKTHVQPVFWHRTETSHHLHVVYQCFEGRNRSVAMAVALSTRVIDALRHRRERRRLCSGRGKEGHRPVCSV